MESAAQRPKLLVIVGETGSGKSALAMRVAKEFSGEIIAADSRTVYRGMDIGTAKPSIKDRQEIPHHLVDIVDVKEKFSVADFKKLAETAIKEIHNRGKLPIMVGGSGLYIDSVLYDYKFSKPGSERNPRNPRHLKKSLQDKNLRLGTILIGLRISSEELRTSITNRVNAMVDEGLIEEVKSISGEYGWQGKAILAPGYLAFRKYIEGKMSLQEAKTVFIQKDLHLAKRQRTWFKRNPSIQWFSSPDEAYNEIYSILNT